MTPPPRLKTDIMARAILRQSGQDGRSAMLLRKGDPDAGGILVVLAARNGSGVVLSQTRTPEGEPAWLRATGNTPVDAEQIQKFIERQVKFDPDLWVLEIESDSFSPSFEAILL
ncbi:MULTISPECIES: DUF1491 family protein [Acetobacter]|uniref:GMP synthase (Glutamine-hydrolyzing) n=1 Tax=Acetobacter ascendens TaxID=481146 RepID=A0A1Y0V1I3_9PROT|nr:DUF1491 family protein [Acetobacter ascendens]ARW09558.1 GMP synthase (glutamine-hydrolyzing) [Acetobacter ascendens]RCL07188.1 hypothetical protein BBA71_05440 [Acetobacter pasteurianus]GCD74431.1 hypothetical protein NBRC3299_0723 [Acetobacter pasteurianus NBRC 3299]